jgi:hypothetical protein
MSTTIIASCARPAAAEPVCWSAALWIWFALGAIALLLVPPLRGVDAWFGWLPFWLVVAPAIDLVVLRRQRLRERARSLLAQLARRRSAARRQARPLRGRTAHVRRRSSRARSTADSNV